MHDVETVIDTVGLRLRFGPGLVERDEGRVVETLSSLNRHLAHWRPDAVDMRLSVKDRDFLDQEVVLEVTLPGWPPLLAHSRHRDLDRALIEVRRVMAREIEGERARHWQRKGNRHARER